MSKPQELLTVHEVVAKLGVTAARVRVLAQSRGLGRLLAGRWLFTERDVEKMRLRVPGRPSRRS